MLTVEVPSSQNVSFKQAIKSSFQEIEQHIEASYNQLNDSIDKIFAPADLSAPLMSTPSLNIPFKTLEIPSNLNFYKMNQYRKQGHQLRQWSKKKFRSLKIRVKLIQNVITNQQIKL